MIIIRLLIVGVVSSALSGCLLPLQGPEYAIQAPIRVLQGFDDADHWQIGANVLPAPGEITHAAQHGEAHVWYGRVQDGVGKDELSAYLQADAAAEDAGLLRYTDPPTVRVTAEASPEQIDAAVRAVQRINASLPSDWQLEFGSVHAPAGEDIPINGEILILFRPLEESACPHAKGCADTWFYSDGELARSVIYIDSRGSDNGIDTTLLHELLHALGRDHADPGQYHADPDLPPDTIMVPDPWDLAWLPTLDREALLAVYSKLDPGDEGAGNPHQAGRVGRHVRSSGRGNLLQETYFGRPDLARYRGGDADEQVSFGVASRNGLQQPWAFGPAAALPLDQNPVLSGRVTWTGRLLGLTPDIEAVAGTAALDIWLSSMDGLLYFDDLEKWAPNTAPGAVGTGTQWWEGALSYDVNVRGNTFTQISESFDEGVVTGAFFGGAHEAMGGTLERDDLTAAFGGKRQ